MLKAYSIEHLPPNGVEVTDAEVISMRNASGADPHPGHAVVSGSPAAIQGVNLQAATTCFVDDGEVVTIQTADGGGDLAISPAAVVAGELDGVRLNSALAVIQNGIGNFSVQQFDNSASFAVIARVTGNTPGVQLANATTRVLVDAQPCPVKNASGSDTIGGTVGINQGALTGVTLPATTAMTDNGEQLLVQSLTGNPVVPATVINGVLQSIVVSPANAIIATNQVVIVRNQGGSETVPGSLILLTPSGDLDHVKMPGNYGIVRDAHALTVPVTGTYTNTITPQVNAAGVITGFTLS